VANTLSRALLGPAFFCAHGRIAAKAGVVAKFFVSKFFVSKLFVSKSFISKFFIRKFSISKSFMSKAFIAKWHAANTPVVAVASHNCHCVMRCSDRRFATR
jgi:hypothetical protein